MLRTVNSMVMDHFCRLIVLTAEYVFTRHANVGRLLKATEKAQMYKLMAEGCEVLGELQALAFSTMTGAKEVVDSNVE